MHTLIKYNQGYIYRLYMLCPCWERIVINFCVKIRRFRFLFQIEQHSSSPFGASGPTASSADKNVNCQGLIDSLRKRMDQMGGNVIY